MSFFKSSYNIFTEEEEKTKMKNRCIQTKTEGGKNEMRRASVFMFMLLAMIMAMFLVGAPWERNVSNVFACDGIAIGVPPNIETAMATIDIVNQTLSCELKLIAVPNLTVGSQKAFVNGRTLILENQEVILHGDSMARIRSGISILIM